MSKPEKKWTCEDSIEEIMHLSPWLLIVLADAVIWGRKNNRQIIVTSLLREAGDGISESTTHQEGRAIDLAVRGWSMQDIESLAKYLNDKYANKIGTGPSGKPSLVCKYHNNGNGWHFHLQVRRYIENANVILS